VFTEASWTSNTLLLSFGTSDGGAPHGCIAFSDQAPALAAVWPILMEEKGTFLVEWDKAGYCTSASATDSIHY
jgi:hypothetical protein